MNDPMSKALEQSLAEATLAVESGTGRILAAEKVLVEMANFRAAVAKLKHDRFELAAAISDTITDTPQLVALAQCHRQDSESVDVFEATKDAALDRAKAAESRLAALTALLQEEAVDITPTDNYCWWCHKDVNGMDGPQAPHTNSCWKVRVDAALKRDQ